VTADRKRLISEVVALLVVVALIVAFMSRRREAPAASEHRLLMGTIVSMTALDPEGSIVGDAVEAAFDEMARVEALTTRYSGASEISRLNERPAGVTEMALDPEVALVIERSLEIARASGGAFDITVAPLVDLWDLQRKDFAVPAPEDLAAALGSVGHGRVSVEASGGIVSVAPGTALDLDGVAKGYAVDRALSVLAARGVASAIVDAGGDVGFLGSSRDARGWKVGVKHPRAEGLIGVLTVAGGSVATSGDYQRYAVADSVRYHHVLDPATGYPARGVISATVTAERAMDADALATAVFVMGAERGLEFVESLRDVEAVIITGGEEIGEVIVSSGLAGSFEEY
jgi:thiamine biosynthesis lipoprotein